MYPDLIRRIAENRVVRAVLDAPVIRTGCLWIAYRAAGHAQRNGIRVDDGTDRWDRLLRAIVDDWQTRRR